MKNYKVVYPLIDERYYETPAEPEYECSDIIQSALDEMGANGGGAVALERGAYFIKKTLRVPKNVTLCGVSENGTQIYQHDANGREWNLIECEDGATVRDLRINVRGTHKCIIEGKNGLCVERISVVASPYFKFTTVSGENMDGAIMINAVGDNITVKDCEMLGIGRGIVVKDSRNVTVDSVCIYTSGKGIDLLGCEGVSATLCTLRGKTQKANDKEACGVKPTADCSVVIDGCKDVCMSEIGIHDIRINPSAVFVTDSENVEINNLLAEIVEYAVVARNSKNVKICGVDAVRCKGVDADGATVEDVRVLVNY